MNALADHTLQQASPFLLNDESAYQRWRDEKLAMLPGSITDLVLEVKDPKALTDAEKKSAITLINRHNFLIYKTNLAGIEDKDIPRLLGQQLGLRQLDPNMLADDDGITSLSVVAGKSLRGYIPYSDKRLSWHTDGYYNASDKQIRAFILHCVRPAAEGGESCVLDPELLYIQLRDRDRGYIESLLQPDAMTIPANVESGVETRPAQTGPVFSLDPETNRLHMRYTARTRSIVWAKDATTQAAVTAMADLLNDENPYVWRFRLAAGEGVLSNNVLHSRSGFSQGEEIDSQRLLYRARYYQRVTTC